MNCENPGPEVENEGLQKGMIVIYEPTTVELNGLRLAEMGLRWQRVMVGRGEGLFSEKLKFNIPHSSHFRHGSTARI